MGTDLPGALIRLILFSGFAADIAGQLSLAVFVGGLVEIPGGTDDHEHPEEWIFQRRFHRTKEWNLQNLWYSC